MSPSEGAWLAREPRSSEAKRGKPTSGEPASGEPASGQTTSGGRGAGSGEDAASRGADARSPHSERRTVLLTGATGFLGSHIAAALEAGGWRVRVTLRPSSDPRWLEGLGAERAVLSLGGEPAGVKEAVRGAECVVHAAGITRARGRGAYLRVNAEGTEALARAAAGSGVRRFVLVSSLAARGPDRPSGGPPAEDLPESPYGRSKLEAERRLERVAAEGGPEPVVLRPGGIYGPRDRDLLPLFRAARRGVLLAPAGRGALQPVYVEDAARAAVRALEGRPGPGPWPVAGREVADWPRVAEALGEALGLRVRVVRVPAAAFVAAGALAEAAARVAGGEPAFDLRRAVDLARRRWTCDPGPTERALGWRPEVRLAEGVARTVRWYREAGWL